MDSLSTVIRKAQFLRALERNGGGVSAACRQSAVSRKTVYDWRKEDKEFAAAWDEALLAKDETLEVTAYERAVHGIKKPIHYKGVQCDEVIEYDNTLLWNLLKASNPAKYRDTAAVQVNLGDELVARLNAGRQRVGRSAG
jgi:hypothetical protein